MESWRLIWRNGFASLISTAGLTALAKGLRDDDPRITQGSTTTPPPLMCVAAWPVQAADPLAFTGWQGDGIATVGELESYFQGKCLEVDEKLKEPAACGWFLNWLDDTPRAEMRRELLAEVELELAKRKD